jgi:hypothetical protein
LDLSIESGWANRRGLNATVAKVGSRVSILEGQASALLRGKVLSQRHYGCSGRCFGGVCRGDNGGLIGEAAALVVVSTSLNEDLVFTLA